jgi:hypothetical protein
MSPGAGQRPLPSPPPSALESADKCIYTKNWTLYPIRGKYIPFDAAAEVMKTAQYKWSQSEGWRPDLPSNKGERQDLVFALGARPLLQAGQLIDELRGHFKRKAAILGCSTSGEIVGDTVVDGSVIATVVDFVHTRLPTLSATITRGDAELFKKRQGCLARQ